MLIMEPYQSQTSKGSPAYIKMVKHLSLPPSLRKWAKMHKHLQCIRQCFSKFGPPTRGTCWKCKFKVPPQIYTKSETFGAFANSLCSDKCYLMLVKAREHTAHQIL